MHIVLVSMHVKADKVKEFEAATIENARNTVKEPGVVRFDLIRQADEPTRYALFEVYHSREDHSRHRETAHYKRWLETAEPLLQESRTRLFYENVFPGDESWK